jgi:putative transposase
VPEEVDDRKIAVGVQVIHHLAPAQMRRLMPLFPRSRGLHRIDDRWMISGIICHPPWAAIKDAPIVYGPPKALYNRFIRWSRLDVFARIFASLAADAGTPERLMLHRTHLKAHRTAAQHASLMEHQHDTDYRHGQSGYRCCHSGIRQNLLHENENCKHSHPKQIHYPRRE